MYRKRRNRPPPEPVKTMTAVMSWFISVMAVLGLVLALNHLGVDVMSAIGSFLHGTEQFLGRPLLTF